MCFVTALAICNSICQPKKKLITTTNVPLVYVLIRLCVTWQAAAVVYGVSLLDAGASILTW